MLSLCGMKKQQKYTNLNNLRAWALTALALPGLIGLAYGQGEPLSELAPLAMNTVLPQAGQSVPSESPSQLPVRITDDGRGGDGAMATAQLILAFESKDTRSIAVDVLDERGHLVRKRILAGKPGKNALTVDLADLREGRYVARITEGAGIRMVRFHR